MTPAQSEEQSFLDRLTGIIEENLSDERFGASELARLIGMSHSNLHRRVKKVTGRSISHLICRVRLERAMEMLRSRDTRVKEVAFACGFSSVSYFSKCFKDHFGYPPGQSGREGYFDINSDDPPGPSRILKKSTVRSRSILLGTIIFILLAVIVIIIVFDPFSRGERPKETSIAVLPFINDSPDETEMWFLNGAFEAILNNLSSIGDLRVPGRTTVEQYRNNPKPIPEIADELNVSYILEGSGLKHENNIRLTLQLVDGTKDRHVWSGTYDQRINHTEELFALTGEIARTVAGLINTQISIEERELMERMPTRNIEAYTFYQKGRDMYTENWHKFSHSAVIDSISDLYKQALSHDSTFARAYIGLGRVYWEKRFESDRFSGAFIDTILILTDKALSFDSRLAETYILRGDCYNTKGLTAQAINEYKKAREIDPGSCEDYIAKGTLYMAKDLSKAIDNFHRAKNLIDESRLGYIYGILSWAYTSAGFPEKAVHYLEEYLVYSADSLTYFTGLGWIEFYQNRIEDAIPLFQRVLQIDSSRSKALEFLGECYLMKGQYDISLKYFRKWFTSIGSNPQANLLKTSWLGYVCWQNGYGEEAEYYFDAVRNNWYRAYEVGRYWERYGTHYVIAGIRVLEGNYDEAIAHLKIFSQKKLIDYWWLFYFKNDPYFDPLRNDPEFKHIESDVEAAYQAEHERVRKWLEAQGMI